MRVLARRGGREDFIGTEESADGLRVILSPNACRNRPWRMSQTTMFEPDPFCTHKPDAAFQ